jgi:hypothetical protein
VAIQPVPVPEVGLQVILVAVTVTPPKGTQFPMLSVPFTSAHAVGAKLKNRAAPTANELRKKMLCFVVMCSGSPPISRSSVPRIGFMIRAKDNSRWISMYYFVLYFITHSKN